MLDFDALSRLVEQGEQLAANPIGNRLGGGARSRQDGFEIIGDSPLGNKQLSIVGAQPVLLAEALVAGCGQLRQACLHLSHPGLVHHQRRQVGLGEIAVIVGFFLAALGQGDLAGIVPAQGLLLDCQPLAQQPGLALDFILYRALQGAEAVQVLDLAAGAESLRCPPGARRHSARCASPPSACRPN